MKKSFMKTAGACLCICISTSVVGNSKTLLTEAEQKERVAKYKVIAAENLKVDKLAFEEACIKAKKSGKYLLVVVKMQSCGWCRIFDKVLKTQKIKPVVEDNYIQVNIDRSSSKEILVGMRYIGTIPNIAIITGDLKPVKRFNPESLETKKPMGYDLNKLQAFLLKWAPQQK